MRFSLALVAIVAMACSGQTSQSVSSPAAPPSPTPVAAVQSASPSSVAFPLACRIPVEVFTQAGINDLPGGWITFPGAAFQLDPASNIQRNPSEGVSFDRAVNKWVPADWNHISPDGRRFVTEGLNSGLSIVDAASGTSRAIAMPQVNGVWSVIDFTTAGVYLTDIGGEGPADPGLWVLNPDSGEVRKLDGSQFWSQVDSRAAWGVTTVAGAVLLRRLDLQTLAISTQLAVAYHTPAVAGDQSLELISIDAAGRPLVLMRDWQQPFPWHMALLTAPETLGDVTIPTDWAGWPVADNGDPFQAWRDVRALRLTGGIWMVGSDSFKGLALLSSDGIVRQLTTSPDIAQIAGGCH